MVGLSPPRLQLIFRRYLPKELSQKIPKIFWIIRRICHYPVTFCVTGSCWWNLLLWEFTYPSVSSLIIFSSSHCAEKNIDWVQSHELNIHNLTTDDYKKMSLTVMKHTEAAKSPRFLSLICFSHIILIVAFLVQDISLHAQIHKVPFAWSSHLLTFPTPIWSSHFVRIFCLECRWVPVRSPLIISLTLFSSYCLQTFY